MLSGRGWTNKRHQTCLRLSRDGLRLVVVGTRVGLAAQFMPGLLRQIRVTSPDAFQILRLELFQIEQRICASCAARISSSSLICIASASRFCVFWMRNTIRNVMMVVPVLMTSCQVSLKSKRGPLRPQTTTTHRASMKARGPPMTRAAVWANRENRLPLLSALIQLSATEAQHTRIQDFPCRHVACQAYAPGYFSSRSFCADSHTVPVC